MSATPIHARAEGVAEVMEAERAQVGSLEGDAEALRERRTVEVAASDANEDHVVIVGEELALAEARKDLGDARSHRHRSDPAGLW